MFVIRTMTLESLDMLGTVGYNAYRDVFLPISGNYMSQPLCFYCTYTHLFRCTFMTTGMTLSEVYGDFISLCPANHLRGKIWMHYHTHR